VTINFVIKYIKRRRKHLFISRDKVSPLRKNNYTNILSIENVIYKTNIIFVKPDFVWCFYSQITTKVLCFLEG